jgi:Tol biopolymer transport system component
MKTLFGLATLLAVACSLGGGVRGAEPSTEPGTIVFTSDRNGDFEIYAVNPDGTGLTQLTHNDYGNESPYPSPDGRLIAFYSGGGDSLMNADGSGQHRLTRCSGTEMSWSPDSTRLVCTGEVGSDDGLVVVDVATGTTRRLVRSGDSPHWSPDGHTISFVDKERLWVIPADGGTRRRIGGHRYEGLRGASWSPDSQRLAYTGAASRDRADLFTIGPDGSGERRVVRGTEEIAPVTWSPDGSLIAFIKGVSDELDVFTAHPDGTGLKRVTSGTGRGVSTDPSWSADGTQLLYLRQRYRGAEDDDIFITTPGTGEGRPVTHPFPTGGTNLEPHWTIGAPLTGTEPSPPTIALPLTRALAVAGPIGGVTTDGRRAIPVIGTIERAPSLLVWDAVSRHTTRVRTNCAPGEVTLAGRRIAWTCVDSGNTYTDITLETIRLGARRPTFVAETYSEQDGYGQDLGSLVGRGNTIAFTTFNVKSKKARAWIVLARHARKCPRNSDLDGPKHTPSVCRRLGNAAGGVTTSVDAGRILTVARNGLVLSTNDRVLRSWSLGRGIVNARLRGRTLAVQHGSSLDTYDTTTGEKRQTLPLVTDEGLNPHLLDVQDDLVTYATGGAIHLLRLSTGRDVALDLPGAAPWLDARLEPTGLFVSWNKMWDRRPGRLAFVSLRDINTLL